MTLQEVTKQEQFEAYYKSNMLQTLDEKINNLKKEMKIKVFIYPIKSPFMMRNKFLNDIK